MLAAQNSKKFPHQATRMSNPPRNEKGDNSIRNLKSQLINCREHMGNNLNEQSPERVLQNVNPMQAPKNNLKLIDNQSHRVYTEQNCSNMDYKSYSARSTTAQGFRPIQNNQANPNLMQHMSPNRDIKRNTSRDSLSSYSPSTNFQFKGPSTNASVHHNVSGLQRNVDNNSDMYNRLKKAQEQIYEQHQQFLKKCLEVQKNKVTISQLEQDKSFLHKDIENYQREIQNLKKNGLNLSQLLNKTRLGNIKLQGERNNLTCLLNDERIKYDELTRQKQSLQKEIQAFKQVKKFMLQLQQTQQDKKVQVKNHIAYELRIMDINIETHKQLDLTAGDLKQAQQIHTSITQDIEEVEKQIGSKIKEILGQKLRLEQQLQAARQQTESIRKNMILKYQDHVSELKNQIMNLKEEIVILKENSDSHIEIAKLERQIKILTNKNQDLLNRNKETQELLEKYKSSATGLKKNVSEISSQTSLKAVEYYDGTGHADLQSIIKSYETRSTDLNTRIIQKQARQEMLKIRVEQLEQQNQQLKDKLTLKSRKQRSITQSSKNQIQAINLQQKNQRESYQHKLQTLQANLKRKTKQIKEKDDFITQYLLNKVKNMDDVQLITQGVKEYFQQKVSV